MYVRMLWLTWRYYRCNRPAVTKAIWGTNLQFCATINTIAVRTRQIAALSLSLSLTHTHTHTHTKQFGSHLRLLHGLGSLGRHVPERSMVPVRSKCYTASHEFVVAVEAASLLFFCLYKIPGGFVRTLLLYQLLHCLIIRHCYSFWIRTDILTACLPYSSVHTSHNNPCTITISVLALFITRRDIWIFKTFQDVVWKTREVVTLKSFIVSATVINFVRRVKQTDMESRANYPILLQVKLHHHKIHLCGAKAK